MVLGKFLATFPSLTVEQLSQWYIEMYLSKLLLRASNRTANSHLTGLKSFCRWLSENYEVSNVAANVRMLKEDPPKQRVIDRAQYLKILSVATEREADCIRFLGNTGIRSTEVTKVTWDCIDQELKWLTVYGKGRKVRFVPINSILKEILSKYQREPETHIHFLESKRHRLNRLCLRLARRAAISSFGPHALRHYFATELYSKGVPVNYISKLLGHGSTKVTELIYVHFQSGHLEGVTEILCK